MAHAEHGSLPCSFVLRHPGAGPTARVYSVLLCISWQVTSVLGIGECPETAVVRCFAGNHCQDGFNTSGPGR